MENPPATLPDLFQRIHLSFERRLVFDRRFYERDKLQRTFGTLQGNVESRFQDGDVVSATLHGFNTIKDESDKPALHWAYLALGLTEHTNGITSAEAVFKLYRPDNSLNFSVVQNLCGGMLEHRAVILPIGKIKHIKPRVAPHGNEHWTSKNARSHFRIDVNFFEDATLSSVRFEGSRI